MQIIHKIDDFFFNIFPNLNFKQNEQIIQFLEEFYTFGSYKPKINIFDGYVKIEIDVSKISSQQTEYKKVVYLCENGKFNEAKPILNELIKKDPTNSYYYRIMGQILSEENNQEAAIDSLIDALRWNPKNNWALIMMGNIFAKFKNDIDTAMKYYDQALIVNPNDNITLNNIAANLMQLGKTQQAKKFFQEAVKINDKFPNTHFALGMIGVLENDLYFAFESTILAIKLTNKKDALYFNSIKQAFDVAKKIISSDEGNKIIENYKTKLEVEGACKVELIEDDQILTAAKLELAENYERESHLIKYNPKYQAFNHLIMHELVHLDLVIQARKMNENMLFISNDENKKQFIQSLETMIKKLNQMGISDKSVSDLCINLFDGINRQIFNTPIDLFIENFLNIEFKKLHPFQFISLHELMVEGLKSVTDSKIIEIFPESVVSKSKIYNLVYSLQFKDLFGIDSITEFKPNNNELKLANEFYNEYKEYKDDKAPGEEYELVMHWAEDLKLEKNFRLVNEKEFRAKSNQIENLITSLENEPFDQESLDNFKERETLKILNSQSNIGLNTVVVIFMIEALNFFKLKTKEEIKKIAFEIATLGIQGIKPENDNYHIPSIKDKSFTGYQILAYYYTSWSIAIPEMVSQLKLPFDKEYQIANGIFLN